MIDGFTEQLGDWLVAAGYEDWDFTDSTLTCPDHGYTIEHDGECPEGCVSPLRMEGLI